MPRPLPREFAGAVDHVANRGDRSESSGQPSPSAVREACPPGAYECQTRSLTVPARGEVVCFSVSLRRQFNKYRTDPIAPSVR